MIEIINPIEQPHKFITAFFIMCGIWADAKLAWMVYYEMFYYRDAGIDYLKNGKDFVKNKMENIK